ncbi:MAG TPA: DUF3048 domain-containing protein [Patescibacteria group bacterium]|nr:DUF3048 domain-containing protein [Patescibacteria group bacterium]
MDPKTKNLVTAILIYVISSALSFVFFARFGGAGSIGISAPIVSPKIGADQQAVFDASLPKTEECPINGAMYSKQQKAWWEKHRPLGVMIENSTDARPQSGMSFADVTYEAVAEGGITRFLNIFYCQDAGIVGPVRSARTYFLDFVSEYADYPLYAHVGGANTPGPADALGQIDDYGWQSYNDLNQFSIGFPTYWRDYDRAGHEVATEHTMYSSTQKLWDVGATRKLTNVDKDGTSWDTNFVPYKFKDDAASSARPASQTVSFDFSGGYTDYSVKWVYDPKTNQYLRFNGGQAHMDRDTKKQMTASDVVVLFMTEQHANDGYTDNEHMLYGTKGTGKATIFMDGKQVSGSWSKKSRTARTILTDSSGQEVKFTRGHIWFEVLGIGTPLTVK